MIGAELIFNGFFLKSKVPNLDSILISTSSNPVIGNPSCIFVNLSFESCSLSALTDPPESIKDKVAVTIGEYKLS